MCFLKKKEKKLYQQQQQKSSGHGVGGGGAKKKVGMEGEGEGSNEKVWFHRTAQANRPVKALRGGQVFGQQVVEGCKVSAIGWHGQRVGDGRLASSHFC